MSTASPVRTRSSSGEHAEHLGTEHCPAMTAPVMSSPAPRSAPTDTLFVNIQAGAGMTFAIWGNWRSLGV